MTTVTAPPVLVVVQLSGGNDFMNTVIPISNGIYHDSRPILGVSEEDALPLNNELAWNPVAAPLKSLYDQGNVAIVQGIGYENHNRSHFRGMDIWHTCEPEKIVTEGWLGKTIRELDPSGENVVTGVSFGKGLPRAMVSPGVPVTSVSDLDSFGVMSAIDEKKQKEEALNVFKRMYTPVMGSGVVADYLSNTGTNALASSEILGTVPGKYTSTVEYADDSISKSLRDVARVHTAGIGTRVFYTQHGGYDTHATQLAVHPKLLQELTRAIVDFFEDLRNHNASEEVVMLVFSEFGRRIKDNGSGTDHGSGGGAFLIGDRVEGGLYGQYPSLEFSDLANGEDMGFNIDFRGVYSTLLDQWLGLDASPIVNGTYEQISPFKKDY
ncbi:MAG: DUF1501 domain-containing protein [SAR202 cluster bacterium]|nr:DUF1501 domain-containing protein [SAR202 cluster bacterium]|tara:strand:- start:15994 stop:17136 length:1143 start_codon:yes stop_codon:yes gene_type:complete